VGFHSKKHHIITADEGAFVGYLNLRLKIKLFSMVKDGFQHTYQGPDFGEIKESCLKTMWKKPNQKEEDDKDDDKF